VIKNPLPPDDDSDGRTIDDNKCFFFSTAARFTSSVVHCTIIGYSRVAHAHAQSPTAVASAAMRARLSVGGGETMTRSEEWNGRATTRNGRG